jgi:hypothetical protein
MPTCVRRGHWRSGHDDRRTYRSDSAEAVAVACYASMLLMALRRVLALGAPDGEATTAEAASPEVCECVAIAAIQIGKLDYARERAAYVTPGSSPDSTCGPNPGGDCPLAMEHSLATSGDIKMAVDSDPRLRAGLADPEG